MDQYEWVRTAHRVYKKSIRQIARETGHTRRTVRKVLAGQDPKYRREKEPACPVMDPVAGIVEGWLRADREQPVKQRHTAHRVWRHLVDEHGFTGAEPTVRRWVRERKMRLGWHRPGGSGADRIVGAIRSGVRCGGLEPLPSRLVVGVFGFENGGGHRRAEQRKNQRKARERVHVVPPLLT